MSLSEQLAKSIDDLPEEAQSLLIDFIGVLQKRYSTAPQQEPDSKTSVYEAFEESGLIGCISVGDGLSANYKQVLAEELHAKYNHR